MNTALLKILKKIVFEKKCFQERDRESEKERDRVSVCVCVCV